MKRKRKKRKKIRLQSSTNFVGKNVRDLGQFLVEIRRIDACWQRFAADKNAELLVPNDEQSLKELHELERNVKRDGKQIFRDDQPRQKAKERVIKDRLFAEQVPGAFAL